jgi:hypothetical protein
MKTYFPLERMARPTRPSPAARFIAALALACVTACGSTLAFAEQGASADELLNDANQVLQQLDTNRYAALWQDAAPFVKASMPQERFTSQMQQARQSVGAVTRRGWASVTRIQYNGVKGYPDGLYANVDFATTLASGRTMFEMLSFRLGDDGQWHLTGYVPRQNQDQGAVQSRIATP